MIALIRIANVALTVLGLVAMLAVGVLFAIFGPAPTSQERRDRERGQGTPA
jgi:hypothetical protein